MKKQKRFGNTEFEQLMDFKNKTKVSNMEQVD